MKFKQGDIWWIQCDPSIGHEFRGKRPAVIIQATPLLKEHGIVTVMIMTSHKGRQWEHDILVRKSVSNKLYADSLVKCRHIISFDISRFLKKIGVLDGHELIAAKNYIHTHFGL